jgi:serine/threonine-protein kinase
VAFEVGQIVGDYEVLELLGSGGMGRVYRVRNVISNRVEAMKAIQAYTGTEAEVAARFSAEIRTLAAFDHPNIAQLRTAFQYENEELMVMEFVEGSTLDKLSHENKLSQGEVVKIVLQILSALSYAHGRGVVHRDIKPANVMVTPAGAVKLMDFGIAKSRAEAHLTQPGSTIGSFYYMSPEQVRGVQVDGRSDLYSVGILLYEFFSGRRPFQAETTHALLTQQLNESPQPPIEVNPNVPRPVSDLILMAMAKDPAQRFQTADAFAKALGSIANQLQPAASLGAGLGADSVTEAAPAGAFPSPRVPPPAPAQTAWTQIQPIPATRGATAAQSAAPPPVATKSHRALWILGGALAVIVVFIAALTLAPRFSKTAAMSKVENPSSTSTEAASRTPAASPSAATPAPPVAATASTASQSQAPPVDVASQNSQQPVTPPVTKTVAKATRIKPPQAEPAPGAISALPNSSSAAPEQPPTQQPAPQAVPSGPSEEELSQAQDELIKLNSRASTVAGSVERLQQQQATDGLGLRQDMAAAYSRMNGYLQAANNELTQRNLTAATRHMNLAEKEISTLESFFNK